MQKIKTNLFTLVEPAASKWVFWHLWHYDAYFCTYYTVFEKYAPWKVWKCLPGLNISVQSEIYHYISREAIWPKFGNLA